MMCFGSGCEFEMMTGNPDTDGECRINGEIDICPPERGYCVICGVEVYEADLDNGICDWCQDNS